MHIAICGSAPSSVMTAPVKDASYTRWTAGSQHAYPPMDHSNVDWEIWGCSPGLFGVAERVNRWFEVHRWEPGKEWFSPQYCQWLREFRGPVYTGQLIPEIPGSVQYPLARVENEFGPYFLTSSLALMFAIAILEIEDKRRERQIRAEEAEIARRMAIERNEPLNECSPSPEEPPDTIGLFGVDMSATEEYEYQRPGCQFFILEALRRGIRVYVPPESDILRPLPIYGLTEWDDDYIKATARARELNRRMQDHNSRVATDTVMGHYLRGATDNLNYFIKTWMGKYALPAGVYITQEPGTGLGGAMRMLDSEIAKEPDTRQEVAIAGDGLVATGTWKGTEHDGQILAEHEPARKVRPRMTAKKKAAPKRKR